MQVGHDGHDPNTEVKPPAARAVGSERKAIVKLLSILISMHRLRVNPSW